MRGAILGSAIAGALIASSAGAGAHETRYRAPHYGKGHVVVLPPAEGVGCFWHLGRRSCSRYCYWEVDGYRYCTAHERDAHTQTIHPFDKTHPSAAPVAYGRALK
jgi:hypothetical protein